MSEAATMIPCSDGIKLLREQCGLTIEQMATLFEVSPGAVSKWIAGENDMKLYHSAALAVLVDLLPRMRCSMEGKRMFASGYLCGRVQCRPA